MVNKEKHFYQFGPFRIDSDHRLLLRDAKPVPLQPKAFDILLVLLENSEKVVLKDDLLKAVWPDTFVEESNLAQNIFVLRKALGDSVGANRYIVTIPGRGYRFAEKVQLVGEDASRAEVEEAVAEEGAGERADSLVVESHTRSRLVVEQTAAITTAPPAILDERALAGQRHYKKWIAFLAVTVLLVLVAVAIRYQRPPSPLKEADLVLVSDFVNTTGEPIFDDTLKQALTVKLAESPYFNVVLDGQTRKTLGLMKRSPDDRVVPPIAREVCEREGAKAVIGGSIMRLGNKYILNLDVTDCLRGDFLAHEQIEAANQDQVLRQLGKVISPLRKKLGESLNSLQKFDTPIEQATTNSLPALKAYTEGDRKRSHGQDAESIPSYKMAVELDAEFAIAYARLGAVYDNLQQEALGSEYLKKAFERREHISEREKFYIQAHYYEDATRESDKAIETYELWTKVYPHDWIPFNNLCNETTRIGDAEKAITAGQEALRLNPNHGFPYVALALAYQWGTRFAEAKAVVEKAKAQELDGWTAHRVLHRIALIEGDDKAAQRERDWAKGNSQEAVMIGQDAEYATSRGQLRTARALYERSRDYALEKQEKEMAGAELQDEAQFLADLGFPSEARAISNQATALFPEGGKREAHTAIILAVAGDTHRAETLADEAAKERPLDLLVKNVVAASARAAVQMNKKNPARAIEELQSAVPYDFSDPSKGVTTYYRGSAFLQMHSGKDAAAQFQKILDNRGPSDFLYWSLAHLGLARAYALTGDKDKSLAAYREFLELWKNADRDVPILKQAQSEYAKLQ